MVLRGAAALRRSPQLQHHHSDGAAAATVASYRPAWCAAVGTLLLSESRGGRASPNFADFLQTARNTLGGSLLLAQAPGGRCWSAASPQGAPPCRAVLQAPDPDACRGALLQKGRRGDATCTPQPAEQVSPAPPHLCCPQSCASRVRCLLAAARRLLPAAPPTRRRSIGDGTASALGVTEFHPRGCEIESGPASAAPWAPAGKAALKRLEGGPQPLLADRDAGVVILGIDPDSCGAISVVGTPALSCVLVTDPASAQLPRRPGSSHTVCSSPGWCRGPATLARGR